MFKCVEMGVGVKVWGKDGGMGLGVGFERLKDLENLRINIFNYYTN